ncbi:hypothetical protein MUN82_12425 [Hymenobacter aerilatus]|uniref:Uncharacterized protein n=1 Tax=Hymenobacter aerilatus TaxID=2932251 RepID=A0A8T9SNX4_9BACT|nr:hypothetical protein [Hymenobacter aerilatus]UOR03752.1 hypothetical protein MUN82_12425 [Hymenobacter aerilatus]
MDYVACQPLQKYYFLIHMHRNEALPPAPTRLQDRALVLAFVLSLALALFELLYFYPQPTSTHLPPFAVLFNPLATAAHDTLSAPTEGMRTAVEPSI